MLPPKDKKPSPPQSRFRKQQVAEDTEREMTGRPQIHGAAMMDEDEPPTVDRSGGAQYKERHAGFVSDPQNENPSAEPQPTSFVDAADPDEVVNQMGKGVADKMHDQAVDAGGFGDMPDPDAATSPEDAEAQADAHIGSTGGAEKMVAKHQGHIHDIRKRLAAIEGKTGGAPKPTPGAPPEIPNDYDDDGR